MEISPSGLIPSGRVYTDAMPKMTPQQQRQLQRVLGKDAPDNFDKTKNDVPQDVMYQINAVNAKVDQMTALFLNELKSLKNALIGNKDVEVIEPKKEVKEPEPKKAKKEEASPILAVK